MYGVFYNLCGFLGYVRIADRGDSTVNIYEYIDWWLLCEGRVVETCNLAHGMLEIIQISTKIMGKPIFK